MRWVMLWFSLLLATSAVADVDIQYRLDNGNITAAHETPPSIDSANGRGIVTLTGVVLGDITWPVPSGCSAGTGRPEWSQVTDPATVAANGTGLAVRSGLLFFHTTSTLLPGCFLIDNKAQLSALVNATILQALDASNPLGPSMTRLETRNLRVCPNENGNCANAHSKLNSIRNVQSGEDTAFDALLAQIQTLKTAYDAFVSSNF